MLTGMTLGPFFGGFVSDLYGIKAAFYISFTLYLTTFLLALIIRETRSEPEEVEAVTALQGDNSLLRIALVFSVTNVIQGVAFNVTSPVSPVFYTAKFSIDYTQLGIVYALGTGLPSVLVQFPGGRIANRYNRRKFIMLSIILSSPFYATIPLSRNLSELMLSLFLNSAIMNIAWPAYQTLMMDLAPPSKRGFVNGVSMTTMWIGMTGGSALSGLLWEGLGASSPFFVAALLFPLSAIPFLLLKC
jgi:MFS family permease